MHFPVEFSRRNIYHLNIGLLTMDA